MDNTNAQPHRYANWWIPFVSGLVLVVFGIWFLVAPRDSLKTLSVVFGIIVLLFGIFEMYSLIKNQKSRTGSFSFLWGSLLNVILGVLLIANPHAILIVITLVIGFWLIFRGGEQIKRAIILRKNNNQAWKRVLTFGILMIVVAAVLLWHPDIIGFTIALWISIAFILTGIVRIYMAFRLREMK